MRSADGSAVVQLELYRTETPVVFSFADATCAGCGKRGCTVWAGRHQELTFCAIEPCAVEAGWPWLGRAAPPPPPRSPGRHSREGIMPLDETTSTTETTARRSTRLDLQASTVTMLGASGAEIGTYGVADLPEVSTDYLMLVGLRHRLSTAEDPAKAYADLKAGTLPSERGGQVNPWAQAYAEVKVAATANTATPMSEADALARYAGFSREQKAQVRRDPQVLAAYARRAGGDGAGSELI